MTGREDRSTRAEQAMKPAMVTRPSPQLWTPGPAGGHNSPYLKAYLKAAKVDDGTGIAYCEWSARRGTAERIEGAEVR